MYTITLWLNKFFHLVPNVSGEKVVLHGNGEGEMSGAVRAARGALRARLRALLPRGRRPRPRGGAL